MTLWKGNDVDRSYANYSALNTQSCRCLRQLLQPITTRPKQGLVRYILQYTELLSGYEALEPTKLSQLYLLVLEMLWQPILVLTAPSNN